MTDVTADPTDPSGTTGATGSADRTVRADAAHPSAAHPSAAHPTDAAVAAWESLFRAQVAVLRRLSRDPIWTDVSFREYDVLYTLRTRPGRAARLGELAASSLLTQPSLSRMVDRLAERGLVERRAVPGDARGTLVVLTDEGLRVQGEVGRRHAQAIEAYVGQALDPTERATLRRLTDRLRAAQDAIADVPRDDTSG